MDCQARTLGGVPHSTCILEDCTHDRMSGGKGTKRTNSDAAAKKTTFSDKTNHAAVGLVPAEVESDGWGSTLAPLTLLQAASKHAVKLNENRMLYIYIKGQTLDILWVFPFVEKFYHRHFLDTVHGRNSSHMIASSHSSLRTLRSCFRTASGVNTRWIHKLLCTVPGGDTVTDDCIYYL